MTSQRRLARILALQILFELESRPDRTIDDALDQRIEAVQDEYGEKLRVSSAEFAIQLANGVLDTRPDLDKRISREAPAFPVDQISVTDRVALEIAVYEMLHGNEPVPVIINEAVDLAKTYGGESSGSFVNGVLGTIAGKLSGEATKE
ncbi:MAG: transcription antitermination factor NusB [Chloroflexota bacterium]